MCGVDAESAEVAASIGAEVVDAEAEDVVKGLDGAAEDDVLVEGFDADFVCRMTFNRLLTAVGRYTPDPAFLPLVLQKDIAPATFST